MIFKELFGVKTPSDDNEPVIYGPLISAPMKKSRLGGTGNNWLCQKKDGTPVFVKYSGGKTMVPKQNIIREAEILTIVHGENGHVNVVSSYEMTKDFVNYGIVLPFIRGIDVRKSVRRDGAYSVEDACRLMIQVCRGLSYIHGKGVIHSDVKPANIMVEDETNLAKLVDFSAAKIDWTIRTENPAFFTPLYGAPELHDWENLTLAPTIDVYAMGMTLIEVLNGKNPYKGWMLADVFRGHKMLNPPKIEQDIPESLQKIIHGVLEKDPKNRIQEAKEVERELLRV